ncbi:glycosyltransferase family 4 protein [Sulfitobacter sp. D35]|uniref:glycosyltransferase family 4 protein n=1 Tax=Sulfitobacter sp. D35 TaxID=3083252 RepID=UPI00296E61C6|nr:glycosyltransferase family 4 protein [Sulfitobacter sp. D35]MDW4498210.1 glycosyltransferase family 4 protein [Sulfitobacter sp. D35]
MNLLFVHQNMPGQYRELVNWLARRGGHQIVFLTQRRNAPELDGVRTVVYRAHHEAAQDGYGLSKVWEDAAGAGVGAALAVRQLEAETGFKPDIVIGHAGWGELTFLKDVWPDVPVIGFFEYYYNLTGGLVGFDPEDPVSDHAGFFARARNVVPTMNIESVDIGQCPTVWQRDRFPASFHDRLYVCHDGIRTDRLSPDPDVSLALGRLDRPLTRDDEIVTYVARNLERTRGFHILMRALPRILEERPRARILIVGGNETSYGETSTHPGGLRGEMEAELGDRVDWDRVHILGRVPYADFCRIVRLGRCHIYLTMPFVLSWSLLEAMSMQATVVASDVAPVREVMTHGKTGLLVDFFDPDALAAQVIEVLARPADFAELGAAARAHVVSEYDFETRCLPVHLSKINDLVPARLRLDLPG